MKGLVIGKETLTSFDDMRESIEHRADLNFEDSVVDLRTVEFMESGRVHVPNMGILKMTDHAEKQLSTDLGFKWDVWFRESSGAEIQEELQRRLARTNNHRLIRARRHDPNNYRDPKATSDKIQSDGILRAFLGPRYHTLDDRWLFDRVSAAYGTQAEEIGFLNSRSGEDQRSSHYLMFPGGTDGINMGTDDNPDILYPGMKIRNSEVGFTALTVDDFWFRLVCLNGMMHMEEGERLLYRTHKQLATDDFDNMLLHMFEVARNRQETSARRHIAARDVTYPTAAEAKERLTAFLERRKTSRVLVDIARKAFDREPMLNAYGVMNAITRAARDLPDRNARHDFEHLGGLWLSTVTKNAA